MAAMLRLTFLSLMTALSGAVQIATRGGWNYTNTNATTIKLVDAQMDRLIEAYREAGLVHSEILNLQLEHYSNGFTLLQQFRDEEAMNSCYRVANTSKVFENIFDYTNSTVNGSIYT